jgi:hypothetical protein
MWKKHKACQSAATPIPSYVEQVLQECKACSTKPPAQCDTMRHLEEANPPAGSKRPAAPSVRGASKRPKTEIVPVQLPPCELCGNFGHTGNNFKVCPLALGREPLTALLATAEQRLLKGHKGKAQLPRKIVDIIPIKPDGNCMFAALAVSYLCFTKTQKTEVPPTERIRKWGNKLRAEYVDFISLKLAEN